MSSRWRTLWVLLAVTVAASVHAAQDAPAPAPEPKESPAPEAPAPAEPSPERAVVGTITGTVYEGKKKPAAGRMVQLTSRGQDNLLRVTGTDERGHYIFKDLPAGTYDIEVGTDEETLRKKERIEVRPPFRNIVDFEIAPGSLSKGPPGAAAQLADVLKQKANAGGPDAESAGTPAPPPEKVQVRGIFQDAQRRPLAEISIMLLSLEDKGMFQTFSEVDGTFSVAAVPPGPYRVLVVSPGYVSIDLKRVTVAPGSGLNLSLTLVDYPLSFKGRSEDHLPLEEPLRAPADGL